MSEGGVHNGGNDIAAPYAVSSTNANWEEALEQLPADVMRRLLHDLSVRDEFLRERLVRMAQGPGNAQALRKPDSDRMMNRYLDFLSVRSGLPRAIAVTMVAAGMESTTAMLLTRPFSASTRIKSELIRLMTGVQYI